MNRAQTSNQINTESEKISWKCITWNIRGWGGKQDSVKKKMTKIKNEIQQYDIVILTETHLADNEEDIEKMRKYQQEYYTYNVHDKDRSSARSGVTICIKKRKIQGKDIIVKIDKGAN